MGSATIRTDTFVQLSTSVRGYCTASNTSSGSYRAVEFSRSGAIARKLTSNVRPTTVGSVKTMPSPKLMHPGQFGLVWPHSQRVSDRQVNRQSDQ